MIKNYIKLINFTEKLAEKKPNLNIIVRPHPRQNINLVKKVLKKFTKYKSNL